MKFSYYATLFTLSLATLAACSTDQAGQSAAAPPTAPPPLIAAVPPAATPPAATPHPGSAAPLVGLPNATGAAPRLPVAANTRPAARPTTHWVRRPLTPAAAPDSAAQRLAAAPAGEAAPAPPAAAVPAEAVAGSLPDFLAGIAPAGQEFVVRAGRDTVLVGQQGTRILVPVAAFDVPAGSGPVHLLLREFYSTPDIVLAGLGTRAGQQVLETGGMLHLYAEAGGQTVHLRPGKQLRIQLPTRQQLPGMRLYEGVSAEASHAPDWQLAGTAAAISEPSISPTSPLADRPALAEWVKLHPPKSPRWPEFAKGQKGMLQEVERLLPTSKTEQAYLRRKHRISQAEQQALRELSRANHTAIRHAVVFAVQLDSTGHLSQIEPVSGDSVLAGRVLTALRQLPAQRPASFISSLPHRGRTVSAAQGYFSVLYARSGKQLVGFEWLLLDKQLQEELAKVAARNRAEFAKGFDSPTAAPLSLDGGLYYELAAGGLGWINCDRLLQPGPRIEFAVATPDAGTVVSLVFKGPRSILASSRTEGGSAVFEQVPDGAAVTVVALRRANGITYLATTSVSLGQPTPPALDFHPVSLTQLRGELAQL